MSRRVKIKKIDSQLEQQIVTGMVVSTKFLRGIESIYKPELMRTPFTRQVAGWCMDYFHQYGKSPKGHIQGIFNSHARQENADEDTMDLISGFLANISDEYEDAKKFNADYVLDQAEGLFNSRALKSVAEDVEAALANGDQEAAELALASHKPVLRPTSMGIDLYTDEDTIKEAFQEQSEPLFTMPGGLGKLLNEHLLRESLMGIMGREKMGKSWWLEEFAYRALRARCNVAYFQVGDMSLSQVQRRFHIRLAGVSNLPQYCGEMLVPVLDCERNQDDTCKMEARESGVGVKDADDEDTDPQKLYRHASSKYEPCVYCYKNRKKRFKGALWYKVREKVKPLGWREGILLGAKFSKKYKGRSFKFIAHPNNGISVTGINNQLDIWEKDDGFIADVVIVDMADNLDCEPADRNADVRHKESGKWGAMSALRLKRKCLVITSTETDSKSYKAHLLNMSHFAESKDKYMHVTAMFGLNQSPDEKRLGLMRVNGILVREGTFSSKSVVNVLQCLEQGRPCIASYL